MHSQIPLRSGSWAQLVTFEKPHPGNCIQGPNVSGGLRKHASVNKGLQLSLRNGKYNETVFSHNVADQLQQTERRPSRKTVAVGSFLTTAAMWKQLQLR